MAFTDFLKKLFVRQQDEPEPEEAIEALLNAGLLFVIVHKTQLRK